MYRYRALSVLMIALASTLAGGCARSLHELLNRPTYEDKIGFKDPDGSKHHRASAISLDASRRVVTILDTDPRIQFCAEPPPDVATNSLSQLGLNVGASFKNAQGDDASASLGFSDAIKTVAQVLTVRTERLDIYRTAVYSICQMYLNQAMSAEEASAMFRDITMKALESASSVATVPPTPEPLGSPQTTPAATPPATGSPAGTSGAASAAGGAD